MKEPEDRRRKTVCGNNEQQMDKWCHCEKLLHGNGCLHAVCNKPWKRKGGGGTCRRRRDRCRWQVPPPPCPPRILTAAAAAAAAGGAAGTAQRPPLSPAIPAAASLPAPAPPAARPTPSTRQPLLCEENSRAILRQPISLSCRLSAISSKSCETMAEA